MSDPPAAAARNLDLDELHSRIRDRAAVRRGGPERQPAPSAPGADWPAVLAGLAWAEEHADLLHADCVMKSFPGPVQPLARLLGRLVAVLARFLLRRQTDCNHATLTAVYLLGAATQRRLDELDRRVALLEHRLTKPGKSDRRRGPREPATTRDEACQGWPC
jgi:hypothetical protein